MRKFVDLPEFHRLAAAGRARDVGVLATRTDTPTLTGSSRTLRFCFSDGSVDRMGDTIDPHGWDLTDFTRNPVALWAHDSSQPPVGRASNLQVEGSKLMGDIEFATAETYAFADTVFRLLEGKFLRAVSVGFLPLEYSFVDNDSSRPWGIDFKRQQLLEISVCPVPANPNALAVRSLGVSHPTRTRASEPVRRRARQRTFAEIRAAQQLEIDQRAVAKIRRRLAANVGMAPIINDLARARELRARWPS